MLKRVLCEPHDFAYHGSRLVRSRRTKMGHAGTRRAQACAATCHHGPVRRRRSRLRNAMMRLLFVTRPWRMDRTQRRIRSAARGSRIAIDTVRENPPVHSLSRSRCAAGAAWIAPSPETRRAERSERRTGAAGKLFEPFRLGLCREHFVLQGRRCIPQRRHTIRLSPAHHLGALFNAVM
jgi:hypothetical protein